MPTVGFLHSGSRANFGEAFKSFIKNLPNDVIVKEEYADDDGEKLEVLAKRFVDDASVEVILAAGGPQPARILQRLTSRKPIVFTTVADPVLNKFVESLERPGFNMTGMAGQTSELDSERLARLLEFATAKLSTNDKVGVLVRKGREFAEHHFRKVEDRARGANLKQNLLKIEIETVDELQNAFQTFEQEAVKGVVVTADAFFNNNRKKIVQLAAAKGIPAIYQWKEFVVEGGLCSYGPDILEAYEMAGKYVTDILGGNNPADMACSKPTKFEFWISKEVARNLGIEIPNTVLGEAVHVL
jgi:putative ABC transport system substrate-binding protein